MNASDIHNDFLFPIGATLVLIIVARRGLFSPAVFEPSPRRQLPLSASSLIPIGLFWLIGHAAAACPMSQNNPIGIRLDADKGSWRRGLGSNTAGENKPRRATMIRTSVAPIGKRKSLWISLAFMLE